MRLKQKIMIIVILIILLFVISYLLLGVKKEKKGEKAGEIIPTEVLIPTVDDSVKVNLIPLEGGKEVILSIKNIPSKTDSLEYILSYETVEGGLQGVNSKTKVTGADFEKKITLGTCSSGSCVYHQVVGKIKLSLKFNGDYGEKIFEKEYEI